MPKPKRGLNPSKDFNYPNEDKPSDYEESRNPFVLMQREPRPAVSHKRKFGARENDIELPNPKGLSPRKIRLHGEKK